MHYHQQWGLCGAPVGPGQRRLHREPTISLCIINNEAWLCGATVGPGQRKPCREPQIWKELVESKTQDRSWGYWSRMMRTKLHQLQMRQHRWKSLDMMRVVTKDIQNCLLITHNGLLVALDSLHAWAMDRLWHACFILITLPCNINDIPAWFELPYHLGITT